MGSDEVSSGGKGEVKDVFVVLEGTGNRGQQNALGRVGVQVEAARTGLLKGLDSVVVKVGRDHGDFNVLVKVEGLVLLEVNLGGNHGDIEVVIQLLGGVYTTLSLYLETEGDATRRYIRGFEVILEGDGALVGASINLLGMDRGAGGIKDSKDNVEFARGKLGLRYRDGSELNVEVEGSTDFDSLVRVELIRGRDGLSLNANVESDCLSLSGNKADLVVSRDIPGQGEGHMQITELASGIVVILGLVELRLGVVGEGLGLRLLAVLNDDVTGGASVGLTVGGAEEDVGAEKSSLNDSVTDDLELVVADNIRSGDLEALLEGSGSGQGGIGV